MRIRIEVVILLLLVSQVTLTAQTRIFTKDDIEYALDLPSLAWRAISRLDVHEHFEFMNGDDESNGYLRLRKILTNHSKKISKRLTT